MIYDKKLLVCITAQTNSKRLIDKGYEIALDIHAQMHILHVVEGDCIFVSPESTQLLQQLYNYAKELGGVVHGVSGQNIVDTIINFVKKEKITNVLLGEPPENTPVQSMYVYDKLSSVMPYLNINVLERE